MKRLSWLLIAVGIAIGAYPLLDDAYAAFWQWRMLSRWEKQSVLVPAGDVQVGYSELQGVLAREENGDGVTPFPIGNPGPDSGQPAEPGVEWQVLSADQRGQTLGVLKIDKIGLNVPIIAGATEANLKIGAGQIEGTNLLGTVGNVVLAGHRRFYFRRLDEVLPGDEIAVETSGSTLCYRVYKQHIVEPTDTSVLNRNRKDRVLTLITCHPLYTSKLRLVVHAVQVNR